MKQKRIVSSLSLLVVLGMLGSVGGCPSGSTPDPELPALSENPTGMEVLERSITALGGRSALRKIDTRITRGSLNIPSLEMNGTFEIYQARPNKVSLKMEIDGMGTTLRASDGEAFWEQRSHQPLRFLEGKELKLNLLSAYFDDTYYADLFTAMDYVGTETINEVACHHIRLTAPGCEPIQAYYDQHTALAYHHVNRMSRGRGLYTESKSTISDYRWVTGTKWPFHNLEESLGVKVERVVESIELNAKLPEGIFTRPTGEPEIEGPPEFSTEVTEPNNGN